MRSTLETIDGHFEHAVFTTYAVNLRFFEEWVPPLLRAAEVRNIVVFVDETQLATALDERGLRSLGRSYYVVSTWVRPGAFHPKLLMLAGAEGVRACISSANLTVEGQLRNIESAFVLDSGEDEHLAPLASARAFLRRILGGRAAYAADALLAALATVPEVHEDLPAGRVRLVHGGRIPRAHAPDVGIIGRTGRPSWPKWPHIGSATVFRAADLAARDACHLAAGCRLGSRRRRDVRVEPE